MGLAQTIQVSSGQVIRHIQFDSEYVDPRNIDVWLPYDYSTDKKYAVIYAHDGQMLFDASATWNNQTWAIDKALARLVLNKSIRDCIVVGIWNNGDKRHAEYFPKRAWHLTPEAEQLQLLQIDNVYINPKIFKQGMLSDLYLQFIVKELKPFIDKNYSTKTNKANTFIMGSSMGGLISCYAVCEYPNVFHGAICMSTHWPAMNGITLYYLKNKLPNPRSHKIYFDHGTITLDSLYEPYQKNADAILLKHGFQKETNFMSKVFDGADHSESAWSKRIHIPLEWMLKEE